MKRIFVLFLVLSAGLGGLLWLKVREQARAEARPPGSSGVVEGTRVAVHARLAARILRMYVREGDRVKTGDLMAELDCTEVEAAVAEAGARLEAARLQVETARAQSEMVRLQARAAYRQALGAKAQARAVRVQGANARRQSERTERLAQEGVAAETTLENAQTLTKDLMARYEAAESGALASLLSAKAVERQAVAGSVQVRVAEALVAAGEAALARAKAMEAECRLVAPRSGVVTLRAREPGEVVLPGSLVFEVTDMSEPRVVFYVANADLGRVAEGAPVRAIVDAYSDRAFSGKVRRISQEAEFTPRVIQTRSDRERLVYEIEATLEDPSGLLRPGMPVEVEVLN